MELIVDTERSPGPFVVCLDETDGRPLTPTIGHNGGDLYLYAWTFTRKPDGKEQVKTVSSMFETMKKDINKALKLFHETCKGIHIFKIKGYPELTKVHKELHIHCKVWINSNYYDGINDIMKRIWCNITKSKMPAVEKAFEECRNEAGYDEYIKKDNLHKIIGIYKFINTIKIK